MEFSSLFSLASTISGKGSPYRSLARRQVISTSCSWAPSIKGGKLPIGTGRIWSTMSAILLGLVTTTSKAFSLPRYSNSFSISAVVRI